MGRTSIRPATDADDLDSCSVGDVLWRGAANVRRMLGAAPPGASASIFVGELDGQCVGVATAVGAPAAAHGYGIGSVFVRSDARGYGIGGELIGAVERLVGEAGMPGVMVSVPDSEPDGLVFAHHRGYLEHGHHVESRLEFTESTSEVAQRHILDAEPAGFTLETLPDEATDDQWHEAYDFFAARLREAPDSRGGGGAMPYTVFRTMTTEPWMLAVARRDGALVAITCLMRHATVPSQLHTLFTGVHPDARGHRLSCALKAFHAELCRGRGWSTISTRNMDDNASIRAVNRRLGFEPVAGHRDFGKDLSEPA